MERIQNILRDVFNSFTNIVLNITVIDVFDILFLSVILYYIYKFIRNKRAGKLAVGLIFLVSFLAISEITGMRTMKFIFQNIFQVGVIAVVILFQPEFRSMLEKVGGNPILGIKNKGDGRRDDAINLAIREVVTASIALSESKTGALIVFQRSTKLGEVISTGTVIDAQVNSFLIRNIFFNKAPLHDGATIIIDSRIHASGCLLPLSSQDNINKDLGTRHRAAIGLSENSDAIVVVVSEETGMISVAVDGVLDRGFTADSLREKLNKLLISESNQTQKKFYRNNKKNRKDVVNNGEE
ncbi:MAG: diadenylate cyclase CdaA [Clostridia bacterium]|nr:diadenylate cyclase CdaA [Clostridia bacterium]